MPIQESKTPANGSGDTKDLANIIYANPTLHQVGSFVACNGASEVAYRELARMQNAPSPVWGAKAIRAVAAAWSSTFPMLPREREMERRLVRSGSVVSVGHDQTTGVMQVEFYNGWLCEAAGVPSDVYDNLMQSPCFDKTFSQLTDESYPLERIGQIPPIMGL